MDDRHSCPPIEFVPYGVAAWTGARWLEFFEGESGEPAWSVWLAHRTTDGRGLVVIITYPKRRFDDRLAVDSEEPMLEVVARAAFFLGELMRVNLRERDRWIHDFERWPRAPWTIDGASVEARTLSVGTDWAAVTTLTDAYLVILGHEVGPAELALVSMGDGEPYGVDFDEPLRLQDLTKRLADRPETNLSNWSSPRSGHP
jgi:hypothetical protein